MESRTKVLGHPIHQILVTFPIGAFGLSVTSDALHTCLAKDEFEQTATRALDFALITAAAAIPFGVVDWLAIPRGTRARRVGRWHAIGNAALVGLLATSRILRTREGRLSAAKWVSGASFMLAGVTAWLGGELVGRHGIGVSDRHGLDAPSSLRRLEREASRGATKVADRRARIPLPR